MDDAKLNGRTVWERRGEDPYEDLNALSDAVAKSAHIRVHEGRLVLFEAGARRILNREILAELIRSRIVTEHWVNRGTEAEPRWEIEYRPVEPDERTIRSLLAAPSTERAIVPALQKGSSLLARAPKV